MPGQRSPAAASAAMATLRAAAAGCRECPLGALATQTVWGEGPARARLMLVGEQPGDREDRAGRPFVGPAGGLLDRAIAALGWSREQLYVTNAVRHFRFELRGKRRMHETPGRQELLAGPSRPGSPISCTHARRSRRKRPRPRARRGARRRSRRWRLPSRRRAVHRIGLVIGDRGA